MRRVPGMSSLDNAIIEYFYNLGRPGGEYVVESPGDVWYNLHTIRDETEKARNTVNRRIGHLADHGLLEKVERGKYRLTDFGWRLAEDDLTPEEREELKDALLDGS